MYLYPYFNSEEHYKLKYEKGKKKHYKLHFKNRQLYWTFAYKVWIEIEVLIVRYFHRIQIWLDYFKTTSCFIKYCCRRRIFHVAFAILLGSSLMSRLLHILTYKFIFIISCIINKIKIKSLTFYDIVIFCLKRIGKQNNP